MSQTENAVQGTSDAQRKIDEAIRQAGSLLDVSRDQVTVATILMQLDDDERAAISAFITKCQTQKQTTDTIKAAAVANRQANAGTRPRRVRSQAGQTRNRGGSASKKAGAKGGAGAGAES